MKEESKFPIIGLSGSLSTIDSGSYLGRERVGVVRDYIEAIRLSGGVGIILPVLTDVEMIQQQMELVDGLLLTGGVDVAPFFYGEEPKKGLGSVSLERDYHELQLIEVAIALKKPIFGICRGMQVLNVSFGGTLYQDIESSLPSALQHYQKSKPEEPWHKIELLQDTKLHRIMGENSFMTNSFHHQAIKTLPPGLLANAKSLDGLIEGVEGIDQHFVLGVQWHPELMFEKIPKMLNLFRVFVNACKRS